MGIINLFKRKKMTPEEALRELKEVSAYVIKFEDPTNLENENDEINIPKSIQKVQKICDNMASMSGGEIGEKGKHINPNLTTSPERWKELKEQCEAFLRNRLSQNSEEIKPLWNGLKQSIIRRVTDLEQDLKTMTSQMQDVTSEENKPTVYESTHRGKGGSGGSSGGPGSGGSSGGPGSGGSSGGPGSGGSSSGGDGFN